jgi:ribosomal protein L28
LCETAALKCRQRKKQWLNNLQAKVEYLTNDNEQLQIQTSALRDEIMNLKTLLLAHKDCPISQVNGYSNNINPKAIGTQHQQQALLRGAAPGVHPAGTASSGATAAVAAVTSAAAPVSMTPMYTAQSYSQSPHHSPHRHPPQHRLSASSSSGAQSSGLNMVMVSQHQSNAPQPSAVSSSSGVMQF